MNNTSSEHSFFRKKRARVKNFHVANPKTKKEIRSSERQGIWLELFHLYDINYVKMPFMIHFG